MPDIRLVSRKGTNRIEVYSFPAHSEASVHRFATVGLSGCLREDGQPINCELLMVLPVSLGGSSTDAVMRFLLDVAAHGLRADVRHALGSTIQHVDVMPRSWSARSLLLDEPRGEPKDLDLFQVGSELVRLLWVIPIYENELSFIRDSGVDQFCNLELETTIELIDPNRPSLV
jgi:hypothetical protein